MGYKWTEPKAWYNRIYLNFNGKLSVLAKKVEPINTTYQAASFNVNANVQSKKLWYLGMFAGYNFMQNDFYEPRKTGWYFNRGSMVIIESWFESNESKKYSWSADVATNASIHFYHSFTLNAMFQQNMRFNNKFSLSHQLSLVPKYNDMGYTYVEGNNDINFSKRKVNTVENIISAKYSFTNKMGITFRARHYLSTVDNKTFYLLQPDGKLLLNSSFYPNANQDVNFFNIDMVYSWQFAPGSFLNIVWKNATQHVNNEVEPSYFKNLSNTLSADNNNNFSLKVIYFLDYLTVKRQLSRH